MRRFGRYAGYVLFGLAVLGGLSTLFGFISNSDDSEVFVERTEMSQDESLAREFAEVWLTIPSQETVNERTEKLKRYIEADSFAWEKPFYSQKPLSISLANAERQEGNTIFTFHSLIQIEREHEPDEEELNEIEDQELIEILGRDEQKKERLHRLKLEVSVKEHPEHGFYISSTPRISPLDDVPIFNEKPSGTMISGSDYEDFRPFVQQFINAYYSGLSRADLGSYLYEGVELRPLRDQFSIQGDKQIDIYQNGEADEGRLYLAFVKLNLRDRQTGIYYHQNLKVQIVQTPDGRNYVYGIQRD